MTWEELVERLLVDEIHCELAVRVLVAAQDAGSDKQLRALSKTLASGAATHDAAQVGAEMLFARALADLDSPHIAVMEAFTKTWQELGLSNNDTLPPDGLSYEQLADAVQFTSVLSPVVGVLMNHGLIEERHSSGGGGMSFFEGPVPTTRGTFVLTAFGESLLERMREIGNADNRRDPHRAEAMPSESGDQSCPICGGTGTINHSSGPIANYPHADSPLAPVPLCLAHREAFHGRRVGIGRCDQCDRLGEARRACTCGGRFIRIV
jgi:hypothetical protein